MESVDFLMFSTCGKLNENSLIDPIGKKNCKRIEIDS